MVQDIVPSPEQHEARNRNEQCPPRRKQTPCKAKGGNRVRHMFNNVQHQNERKPFTWFITCIERTNVYAGTVFSGRIHQLCGRFNSLNIPKLQELIEKQPISTPYVENPLGSSESNLPTDDVQDYTFSGTPPPVTVIKFAIGFTKITTHQDLRLETRLHGKVET